MNARYCSLLGVARKAWTLLLRGVIALVRITSQVLVDAALQPEDHRRAIWDSESFGRYNFRTKRFDAGRDPKGWYEEDL